jgi:predicted NUDIX family phosphoesterase
MFRELKEEVSISGEWTEQLVGFINDDRTPVGCVHLGVAHLVNLSSASVQAKEDALAEGGFAPVGQLEAIVEEFETWSQFMLNERLL